MSTASNVVRFGCPRCRSILEAPLHRAGDKISCPKCQQRLQIPVPPRDKTVLAPLVPMPSPVKAGLPSQTMAATPLRPSQAVLANSPGRTTGKRWKWIGIGISLLLLILLAVTFGSKLLTGPVRGSKEMNTDAGAQGGGQSDAEPDKIGTIPAGNVAEKSVSEERIVDTEDLVDVYRMGNEVAADLRFKNKVVQVTGTVRAVRNTAATDESFFEVELGGKERSIILRGVYCYFSKRQEGALASVLRDQIVTVRGFCRGKWVNSVKMEECVLVSPK